MTAPPPAPEDLVDARYELVGRLDDRGLGETWAARDRKFKGRAVTVKFLRPLGLGATELPADLARYLRALRGLRHANVLSTLDHGLWRSRPYLVQDSFEGHSLGVGLAQIAASGQRLELALLERIFTRICAGVDAGHTAPRPLLHGCIGLGCVLVHRLPGEGFSVRVMDFGLAPHADLLDAGNGSRAIPYTAPELLTDVAVTRAADVFVLAVLLREMLTSSPSPGGSQLAVGHPLREDVPTALWEVIQRATQLDPARRPATAGVLRDALRDAWTAPAPPLPPPPPVAEVAPPPRALRDDGPPLLGSVTSHRPPRIGPSDPFFEATMLLPVDASKEPEATVRVTSLEDTGNPWDIPKDPYASILDEDLLEMTRRAPPVFEPEPEDTHWGDLLVTIRRGAPSSGHNDGIVSPGGSANPPAEGLTFPTSTSRPQTSSPRVRYALLCVFVLVAAAVATWFTSR